MVRIYDHEKVESRAWVEMHDGGRFSPVFVSSPVDEFMLANLPQTNCATAVPQGERLHVWRNGSYVRDSRREPIVLGAGFIHAVLEHLFL
jgi:hypothetical protein